jgi:MFS family permease
VAGSIAPGPPGRGQRLLRYAASAIVDVSVLREQPAFRLMWTGQLISELGRQVIVIAMPYEVYVRTRSTLAVGLLAAVELVAVVGLSLPGGALADALDRRRLLLLTQLSLGLFTLLLVTSSLLPDSPLWWVYAAAFAISAISAFDRPARQAVLYSMVSRERLNSVAALDQGSRQLASVCGPVAGGLLIGGFGLAAGYGFAAVGFVWMSLTLMRLRHAISAELAPLRRLKGVREGLSFVRQRPVILSTMVMDFTANLFGFPSALFPVLAVSVFRVGAPGLGILAAAPAIGALVTSLFSRRLTSMRRKGLGVTGFYLLWGVAITLFGLATFSFPLALGFLGAAGACDIAAAVLRASIVQGNTPDAMRGRVSSINMLAVTAGPRLGDVEATMVAAATSAGFSVVTGGLLCLLGTLLVARRSSPLLAYMDEPERPKRRL